MAFDLDDLPLINPRYSSISSLATALLGTNFEILVMYASDIAIIILII
jgi:hypothetical protein